tara:strand:- start:313 stop:567 length:255 start_codon:yes stop_codon:yes gene_type:complete
MPNEISELELFAWVGEDELGSGEIGLKQAMCPAGMIPIVTINEQKAGHADIKRQLEQQAHIFGKKIRLCRFKFDGVIAETASGE